MLEAFKKAIKCSYTKRAGEAPAELKTQRRKTARQEPRPPFPRISPGHLDGFEASIWIIPQVILQERLTSRRAIPMSPVRGMVGCPSRIIAIHPAPRRHAQSLRGSQLPTQCARWLR